MAFNINAHVILSGPKNIKAVTKNIQKQLGTVKVRVQIDIPKNLGKNIGGFNKGLKNLTANLNTLKGAASSTNSQLAALSTKFNALNKSSGAMTKSQAKVQDSLRDTGKHARQAGNEIQAFGKDAALALRRFAGFTLATTVVFGFVRAVTTATKAALDFQREITKVVQVTGASVGQINKLKSTINELSVSLGVDANELAELSRIFSQTGQSIDQVRASIRAVARSSLAPSFGEMKNTAEGLIAAMAQFNIAASRSEEVLAGLNAVSKKFAVEAEDLVSVIRRAGGVFSVASGQFRDPVDALNELIGIFTAVRSTTRESADTIAVGLRTIFTRIQRSSTIDFLREFNIELVNAKGQFIGIFPAFQQLSKGLDGIIKSGDALKLSAITEELGGVRQVGKLIPAITQFNKALAATKIAGDAGVKGLGKDVALGLQPLGKQLELIQQRFSALIRTITESKTFQGLAKVALSLGNAFLSVAESLTPLLPLITTFATIKISKGMFDFAGGFLGGLKKGGGAGGVGGTLGGAMSGATTAQSTTATAASTSAQQALTGAVNKNTGAIGLNNAALGRNTTGIGALTPAITNASTNITTASTNVIGAIGNLINALKLAPLGGGPKKFARGGPVKGPSHAQGGVPAVLEGGEYVIPKKYAKGGLAVRQLESHQFAGLFAKPVGQSDTSGRPVSIPLAKGEEGKEILAAIGAPKGYFIGGTDEASFEKSATQKLKSAINQILRELGAKDKAGGIGQVPVGATGKRLLDAIGVKDIAGKVFEGVARAVAKSIPAKGKVDPSATFDIPKGSAAAGVGIGSMFANMFNAGQALPNIDYDAKLSASHGNRQSLLKKAYNKKLFDPANDLMLATFQNTIKTEDLIRSFKSLKGKKGVKIHRDRLSRRKQELVGALATTQGVPGLGSNTKKLITNRIKTLTQKISAVGLAAGGNVFAKQGTDTVPAMLTPGEFVVNKKSAQKIGYGNLGKMNRYAQGGRVQYLRGGGAAGLPPIGGGGGANPAAAANMVAATSSMSLFYGLQSATAALVGFTTALSGFDTKKPTASLMAVGMAAVQGAIAFKLLFPNVKLGAMLQGAQNVAMANGAKEVGGLIKELRRFGSGKWRGGVIARGRDAARRGPTATALGIKGQVNTKSIAAALSKELSVVQREITHVTKEMTHWNKAMTTSRAKIDAARKALVKQTNFSKSAIASQRGFAGQQVTFARNNLQNVMKTQAPTMLQGNRLMPILNQRKTDLIERARGVKQTFSQKLTASQSPEFIKAWNKTQAKMSRGMSSMFNTLKTKMPKTFAAIGKVGIKGWGAIIGLIIVGPIVGAISKGISKAIFGKKEKIEGTNIEGRKGMGTGSSAAISGMLEGAGTAVGAGLSAGLTAAMIPGLQPFAPAIGAAVAALSLVKSAFLGVAKQAEFLAFKRLGVAIDDAAKKMDDFANLIKFNIDALAEVNKSLAKVDKRFQESFKASFFRERSEQSFTFGGMFGKNGVLSDLVGGGGGGRAAGMAGGAASGAFAGAGIGGGIGLGLTAITGGLAAPLIPVLAIIGGVIGGFVGLGAAIFTVDKRAEAAGKAFDKAAKQITPEFLEKIDVTFEKTVQGMMDNLEGLDSTALARFSNIELGSASLNPAEEQSNLNSSMLTFVNTMRDAEEALGGATAAGGRFVKEFNKLMQMKVKFNLVDAIRNQAEFMEKEAGDSFKQAMMPILAAIDFGNTPDSLVAGLEATEKALREVGGVHESAARAALDSVAAQKELMLAEIDAAATAALMAKNVRAAARAFDSLAAGLDVFANSVKGIEDQLSQFTSVMKKEFENLFSDSIKIGQVNTVNPFANIDSSSRSQIRAGMAQVGSLSTQGLDDPAFRGLEGLVSEAKEIPFALSSTLRELEGRAGTEALDASDVMKELRSQLEKRGIEDLPASALKGVRDLLEGAEVGRQGGATGGFSLDELKALLSEEGDVAGQLSGIAGEALSAMEAAFDAATGYRNALLELASLQQELLQKETSMRLSLIDKQQNAIDRMNKALGRTPDAMQTATGHLSKRLTELTKERVGEGGLSTGIGGVGNVFDVAQLINQREQLQNRRKELRGQLGVAPGEIFRTEAIDLQSDAQKKQAKELGLVNAQLNGNTTALKELANDTRMLAAIEQQILELQKKALSAEQSAMTLAKAQIAVAAGEMTPEDFKKNFTDPLNALHTYSRGGEISPQMLVQLQEKFNSGDPAFTGIFDKMIEDIAAEKKARGDTRSIAEIETAERRRLNDQMNTQIVGAGAATGIGGPGLNQISREQLLRGRTLRDKADAKGEEGLSLAEKQAKAQEALFENQKKGFQDIFKAAEEGIDKAVDKFDKAVDKFRDLRGEGLTPLKAEEKKLAADKKVKDLETALAAEADPEKRKRIEEQLLDAKDEQRDATNAALRSTQAQQDEVDRVETNNIANQQLLAKAKEEEAQLQRDKAGQEKARQLQGGLGGVEGGEHFLSNLASQQRISDASLGLSSPDAIYSDIDDMLGLGRDAGWGSSIWGMGNNEEFNEGSMTASDARIQRNDAFESMSNQMFGAGSQQAIDFNKILQDSFAETQDAGGNANQFNRLVQRKLQDYLDEQLDPDNLITMGDVGEASQRTAGAQSIADKSQQTLTDLLATQAQEQQDIQDLRNMAGQQGSLYTHDVHLEKLVHAILTTLQGKEAVSPELSKAAQGKDMGNWKLSTGVAGLLTKGSVAGTLLGGDDEGLGLTKGSVADTLLGGAGGGVMDLLTKSSVAGAALSGGDDKGLTKGSVADMLLGGGSGGGIMDLLTTGSVARAIVGWLTGGEEEPQYVKQYTPPEEEKGAADTTKEMAKEEIAATGNINDDCCDDIVNGLAALGNIFKNELVKIAPEVAKETAKAATEAATADPAASEPAEVVVEMGENERAVRERHRQEDAKRDKATEGVDLSAFEDIGTAERDDKATEQALDSWRKIEKDNKAQRDKEIAEAKAQDAGLLRSPAEQAALDAASRAKHAADIDAVIADVATRVKPVDPKDLENKRKAETAPNIGASEFNARPGDQITRMKAFREAARHSADPSLRDYAGSLAEPATPREQGREERRRRGGLTPRQRVQENVDQVKKELAALEAKQKVAKDTGSGRDFSKAIERKKKQITNMESSLFPGMMPMTARDEAIKAQQAEDQARAKAEADKKAAAAEAAQQEAQDKQAAAIPTPAVGTIPVTQTKVQTPATDVGAALAEAAQSIRTSLVEGGPEIGTSIATSMKDNMEPVGAAIADSMKKHLKGNIIDINAKIGPIQVQLTDGGGALKRMDMGLVSKFEALISDVMGKLFNTNMSIKENISQTDLAAAKNTAKR